MDIMSAMRQAVIVSRMRENDRAVAQSLATAKKEDGKESLAINWKEALYLATRGGATALSLPEGTGIFAVGAPFDAQQSKLIHDVLNAITLANKPHSKRLRSRSGNWHWST